MSSVQTTPEAWRLIARTPDYALASWQQIFAVIWRRETTMTGAKHLRSGCTEFAEQHPRGIGLLTIVEPNAPFPPSNVRDAIAEFLHDASPFIKCSAVLFEGTGFRAATVRSVVTGLTMMARQAYPHKVCDLVEAGRMYAEILTQVTGRLVVAEHFRSTLAELRGRINSE